MTEVSNGKATNMVCDGEQHDMHRVDEISSSS